MIPWKFIVTIVGLVLLIFFVGLNLENSAEIRYWFGEKGEQEMNVLFALFGSFMIGIVVTLPYVFKKKVHYIDFSKEKIKKTKVDKKIKVAKESEIEPTSKLSSK